MFRAEHCGKLRREAYISFKAKGLCFAQAEIQDLQLDLHPLGGGADFGIVAAGVGDDFVDDGVGVVGVVMVENQFFRAAFHHDIDGLAPVAVAPAAAAGERTIPLTDAAVTALGRLRRRAEGFGTVEASHYVFATFAPKFTFSGKKVIDYNVTKFDPKRHLKSWRTAWRTLTRKAGLPGFRFHDLRHCAITQLAGNGTSDSTIMVIAGHVSRRMLERYSHVRMEAKGTAMEALAVSTKTAGYDTNAVVMSIRPRLSC